MYHGYTSAGALHCTALHSLGQASTDEWLRCTALHCTAGSLEQRLHCTSLHYTALHCTVLHCTTLHLHIHLWQQGSLDGGQHPHPMLDMRGMTVGQLNAVGVYILATGYWDNSVQCSAVQAPWGSRAAWMGGSIPTPCST